MIAAYDACLLWPGRKIRSRIRRLGSRFNASQDYFGGDFMKMQHLVIVGQGYRGLPLAQALAGSATMISEVDLIPSVVESLNRGKPYIADVPEAAVATTLNQGHSATPDVQATAYDRPASYRWVLWAREQFCSLQQLHGYLIPSYTKVRS